jgi:hypothetical protein
MTLAVISMVVFVTVVVLGFIILRSQQDKSWRQFAADIGGEFTPGGAFRSSKVLAHARQWTITLDTYSVPSGDSSTAYTRIVAPFHSPDAFEFRIFREGLVGKLDKALGMKDIEIGLADFDRDFIIQSNNDVRVRALLADVKIRQLIQAQHSIQLQAKSDSLRFDAQGVIRDVERLKSLFELFGEMLERLKA